MIDARRFKGDGDIAGIGAVKIDERAMQGDGVTLEL